MKSSYHVFSFIALVTAVVACIYAGIVSNRAFKEITAVKHTSADVQVPLLQEKISRLESRLTAISNAFAELNKQAAKRSSDRTIAGSGDMNAHVSDILVAMNDSMFELEQIVDASGLKSIATNETVDPLIMKQVYDEYYQRKLIETHRGKMQEMNREFHTADTGIYDAELKELYNEARFYWGRKDKPGMREEALNELLEKYPDANATGMIISENAMLSALKSDLEGAERYYAMLVENDNFRDIVNDWNLKAVPTMQYYLATQYIEKDRIDEAHRMINALARNNETMVFVGGEGVKYRTMQDAIKGLRERIEN